MITKDDIGPMLVEAVPELRPMWDEALEEWRRAEDPDDADSLDPATMFLYELCDYIWNSLNSQHTELFPRIFAVLERVVSEEQRDHSDDSPYNHIVIGLFEDLQHEIQRLQDRDRASSAVWDREVFSQWLGPASCIAWRDYAGGWTGLYNDRLWLMHVPRVEAVVGALDDPDAALTLISTDCRIRDPGLQGRALNRMPSGDFVLRLVNGAVQDLVELTPIEARRAFERIEHPVLPKGEAFPDVLLTADAESTDSAEQAAAREIVSGVIRGERPLYDLHLAAVRVYETKLGWYVSMPDAALTPVRFTPADLLAGFRACVSDPARMHAWAFLMHVSDAWWLDTAGDSWSGMMLEHALWDAAFGMPLSKNALDFVSSA